MRVIDSLVPQGGACMHARLRGFVATAKAFHRARPQHAECTQFCDLEEVTSAGCKCKCNGSGGAIDFDAARVHLGKVVDARSKREGHFLDRACAGFFKVLAMNGEGNQYRWRAANGCFSSIQVR